MSRLIVSAYFDQRLFVLFLTKISGAFQILGLSQSKQAATVISSIKSDLLLSGDR
jgi:hypothetical protein